MELRKAVRPPFVALHHFVFYILFPIYFHHRPVCTHFKRLQFCHISGGYFYVLHPDKMVDHTYAFIIIVLFCILMCRVYNSFQHGLQ